LRIECRKNLGSCEKENRKKVCEIKREKRHIRKNKVETFFFLTERKWKNISIGKKGISVKNISIEKNKNKKGFESTITDTKGVCIFQFCLASQ
jgi:hypothetical protein